MVLLSRSLKEIESASLEIAGVNKAVTTVVWIISPLPFTPYPGTDAICCKTPPDLGEIEATILS